MTCEIVLRLALSYAVAASSVPTDAAPLVREVAERWPAG